MGWPGAPGWTIVAGDEADDYFGADGTERTTAMELGELMNWRALALDRFKQMNPPPT